MLKALEIFFVCVEELQANASYAYGFCMLQDIVGR